MASYLNIRNIARKMDVIVSIFVSTCHCLPQKFPFSEMPFKVNSRVSPIGPQINPITHSSNHRAMLRPPLCAQNWSVRAN